MRHYTKIAATSALSWALLAPAAFADLTAQDVWADWKAYMTGMGYTIKADENMGSNRVDVTNIVVEMPTPDVMSSMTMGDISFVGQNDGTVSIVMPEQQSMKVSSKIDDEHPVDFDMDWSHTGLDFVARGSIDNIHYDYKADSISFALGQLNAGDESVGAETIDVSFDAQNVVGVTTMTAGELREYTQQMTTGQATYNISFTDPSGDGIMVSSGTLASLSFNGTSAVPPNLNVASNMAEMFRSGFAFDGVFKSGPTTSVTKLDGPDGPGQFEGKSAGGDITIAMNKDGIRYGGTLSDYSATAQMEALPFPVSITIANSAFDVKMPVLKSDDAKDYNLLIKLEDLNVSDMIWGMIDPMSQLPHDPATLIIDVHGKAKMMVDMLDPVAMSNAAMSDGQPAQAENMNLAQLKLKLAGAELNGQGALTFDNEDMMTIPGMPKPVGKIDLSVDGANGLINNLIAMGYLPEDQAMGFRMMMGMFTVPAGNGEDSLKSQLEFTEDGRLLANGQQLR